MPFLASSFSISSYIHTNDNNNIIIISTACSKGEGGTPSMALGP